jgi:protease-4
VPELRGDERLQLRRAGIEGARGSLVRWGATGGLRAPVFSRISLFFLLLCLLPLSACITVNLPVGGLRPLEETVVFGDSGPKILLIGIDGTLNESDELLPFGMGRESAVALVREQLDRARGDDAVRAILLRINSPGGSASASEQIYSEILRFKHERGVPVVAQLMGTAASGGYYVAMAADEVRAHPTTVTGSIGVIFAGVSFAGLMEKLGVEDQTLTAGEYKDVGSPLRRMKPEERAQLQAVLDDLHHRFLDVVAAGRPALSRERIARVADGRILSAAQALDAGLVDALGGIEEAAERAKARAGLTEARVVSYHRPREWASNLYNAAPAGRMPIVDLIPRGLLGPVPEPGFHYLWRPGSWRPEGD